jgi:alkylated DNA repair dioxygenase AlkB
MYFYCKNIVNRLIEKQFVPHFPHQLTINYYEPNEGLLSHTDNIDVIKEWVIGISLLSSCVITFTKGSDNEIEEKNYFLHPGK